MIDTPENKVCSICRRPKRGGNAGSITQWISTCRCDVQESKSSSTQNQMRVCADCRKRVNPARGGSITQWIFSDNFCKCENPRLVSVSKDEIDLGQTDGKDDETSKVQIEETYLDVDPSEFPIERYKPIRFIGKGALGEVYLCRDAYLRKKVAVKCLLNLTADRVVSFQNEAKIASKLNHPSVISVLDFGTTGSGRPFMVMEYFPGKSLQEIISESDKIDEIDTIELFLPVCRSLQYLHDSGVLHRDLKPSNVLVSVSSSGGIDVRLIDFGLSKTTQDVQSKTLVDGHTIVGTPGYMSPDQVQGQAYDVRSEIYSLGCMMFEAVTGSQPFHGATALEVLNNHVHQPVPSVSALEPTVSQELCDLVEQCLSKERSDRYGSMSEVEEGLAMCRRDSASVASKFDASEQHPEAEHKSVFQTQTSIKNWVWIAVSVASFGVLVVFMLWNSLTQSETEVAATQHKLPYFEDREVSVPTISPSVDDLVSSQPKSMTLWIRKMGRVTKQLEAVAKKYRKDSVSLSECTVFDGDALIIASMFPTRVSFIDCDGITDRTLAELSYAKRLHNLTLEGCRQITPSGFKQLAKIPHLYTLSLTNCELTDQDLKAMKSLKALRVLQLNGKDKITLSGLKWLGRKSGDVLVYMDEVRISSLPRVELDNLEKIGVKVRRDPTQKFD